MSDWKPTNDFEDDLLANQPECDFTFENYVPNSLAGASLFKWRETSSEDILKPDLVDKSKEVKMVSKIYSDVMPSGTLIGSRVTEDNLNNLNREAETIAMIRNTGSISSHIGGFETTTVKAANDTSINSVKLHRSPFPILLDESYFKLKPSNGSTSTNSSFFKSSGPSENSTLSTSLKDSEHNVSDSITENAPFEILVDDSTDDSKTGNSTMDKIDYKKKLKLLLRKNELFHDVIYLGDLFDNDHIEGVDNEHIVKGGNNKVHNVNEHIEEGFNTIDNVNEQVVNKVDNVNEHIGQGVNKVGNVQEDVIAKLIKEQNDLNKGKRKGARKRGLAIRFPSMFYDDEPATTTTTPTLSMGIDSHTRFYTPREIYLMKRKAQGYTRSQ